MTAHCPLCRNTITAAAYRNVLKRTAEREKKLSVELDVMIRQHRRLEEKAVHDAEKAYEKGREDGARRSKKDLNRLWSYRKNEMEFLRSRVFEKPKALLAKPSALLNGLRRKFPQDRFEQAANGIVQTVRFNGEEAGRIVYLCKPDAGWMEELETAGVKRLKERYRAQAGVQVIRSVKNNSCGPDIFIVCQKTVLSFAAVLRQALLLSARAQRDFLRKQEILSRFTV